jgi:hypothetical protein
MGWLGPISTETLVCKLGWFRLVALGDLIVTTLSASTAAAAFVLPPAIN